MLRGNDDARPNTFTEKTNDVGVKTAINRASIAKAATPAKSGRDSRGTVLTLQRQTLEEEC
jgi:hypothetical protein